MKFNYNDGGREAAGFKGFTGDCVCRAIAIATERATAVSMGTTARDLNMFEE
jgi:hypothetical protein